jgi:hypothetical protein
MKPALRRLLMFNIVYNFILRFTAPFIFSFSQTFVFFEKYLIKKDEMNDFISLRLVLNSLFLTLNKHIIVISLISSILKHN